MTDFNCPLCQFTQNSFLMESPAGDIYRCRKCGLALRWPSKNTEELRVICAEKYAAKRNQSVYCEIAAQIIEKYQLVYPNTKPIKILDVGSGNGQLLQELGRFPDLELSAVEPDSSATRLLDGLENVDFLGGTLADVPGTRRFDIVIFTQVLEHCVDPFAETSRACEMMNRGGMLFVTVPNINSCSVLFRRGKESNNTAIPDHLYFFSFRVLERILAESGFCDVLRIAHWTAHNNPIYSLVQYLLRLAGVSREIRVIAFK